MNTSQQQPTQLLTEGRDGTWNLVSDDGTLLRRINASESSSGPDAAHKHSILDALPPQQQNGALAEPLQVHACTAEAARQVAAPLTHGAEVLQAERDQGLDRPSVPGAASVLAGTSAKTGRQYSSTAQGEELRHLLEV